MKIERLSALFVVMPSHHLLMEMRIMIQIHLRTIPDGSATLKNTCTLKMTNHWLLKFKLLE